MKILNLYLCCCLLTLSGCSLFSDSKEEADLDYAGQAKAETEILVKGLTAYEEGLFSIARERFTELENDYPASPYVSFVELKIADTYFASSDYETAYSSYDEFLRNFSGSEAAHYAFFQKALSQLRQYRGTFHDQSPMVNALALFEDLVKRYPDSSFVAKAKEYAVLCQEELAKHELEVAQFYAKQGQLDAAATRLAEATQRYSTTRIVNDAEHPTFKDLDDGDEIFALAKEKEKVISVVTTKPLEPLILAAYADTGDLSYYLETVKSGGATSDTSKKTGGDGFSVNCQKFKDGSISLVVQSPLALKIVEHFQEGTNHIIKIESQVELSLVDQSLNKCPSESFSISTSEEEISLKIASESSPISIISLDRPHRIVVFTEMK